MKRHPIAFRQLLERVLPIEKLPPGDQAKVRDVLAGGDPNQIEKTAMEAMDRLEQLGHLRLVEETLIGDEKIRRFQNLMTADSIAIRVNARTDDEGIYKIPLPLRDWRGGTSLDQVRNLFNLYNKILTQDSQMVRGQGDILRQVLLTARHMLGAERVSFYSSLPREHAQFPVDELASEAYDEELISDWVMGRKFLVYIPELPAQINTQTGELDTRFRSLAVVPIGEPDLGVFGALQAWSSRPHAFGEEEQGVLSLVSEFSTELLRRSQALGNLVFVDAATQVYNRSYFNLQLENEIARVKRERKSMALAIADIDDFKGFNSEFGYEGGNQVLSHAAQILKRGLRPFDSVARWGGEEFALILTAPVMEEDARSVCERLRRSVELSRFTITGLEGQTSSVQVTFTIGGALYPNDGATAADLWRSANAALVSGKSQGKNRVIFASDLPGSARGAVADPQTPQL